MAVTTETLRTVKDLREKLDRMTAEQILTLTRAWVDAWDTLHPEFEEALEALLTASKTGRVTRSALARSERLRGALEHTRATLEELAQLTRDTVSGNIMDAVLDAADGHAAMLASQLPPPGTANVLIAFNRIPTDAISAIVERTTQQIHSASWPLPADVVRAMKQELIRGVAVGANPRKTAREIIRRTEERFNGGLSRALTIARTETLDAHRAATKAAESTNKDVLLEWEWHATLSARTCIGCLSKNGTRHPLEETGPDGHQNCRCARVTVTKSWKDLGFDIEEPASLTPDSEKWFNNLTTGSQRSIMGPERLDLYQSGRVGWSDLSTTRSNPGWRDSVVPTPLKDLR